MLFLRNVSKNTAPLLFAIAGLFLLFAFIPAQQDPGQETPLWTAATITTTTQSQLIPCGQGSGFVGRKTLAVWNSSISSGTITVTAELRDAAGWPNYTSGYLAVNGVAAGAAGNDTALPSEAAGRYCYVTATAFTNTVITAVLRRE